METINAIMRMIRLSPIQEHLVVLILSQSSVYPFTRQRMPRSLNPNSSYRIPIRKTLSKSQTPLPIKLIRKASLQYCLFNNARALGQVKKLKAIVVVVVVLLGTLKLHQKLFPNKRRGKRFTCTDRAKR